MHGRRYDESGSERALTVLLATTAITVGLAVRSGAMTGVDERLRKRQPHPRGGPARTAAMALKHGTGPNIPLALSALVSAGLGVARVRGAERVAATRR